MSHRFYINSPLGLGPVTLDGPEARHLSAVCRASPGCTVSLFNGDGREYQARVVSVGKRSVELEVQASTAPLRELPFALEVAASLPKGDRGQFLIEKLTELGVAAFVPLECQRTVVHPGEGRIEKLQRYVIEASKQCGRNLLMRIEPAVPWTSYCRPRAAERRWLAHPGGEVFHGKAQPGKAIRVAIGPEGGFTDEEVRLGVAHGWERLSLGPRILRVETAAIVAAALLAGG
jgi:16S rRNA (uracil1498-N3)-methyltransferase